MSPRGGNPEAEGAMLVLLGAVLAAATFVWVWGGVAGALFGGGWPALTAGEVPRVLIGLPSHLADPAAAWPIRARGRLPRAPGAYAGLALVLACAAGLIAVARRAGIRLPRSTNGARWATTGDLRILVARRRRRHAGRLVLGSHHGHLLHAEERHALIAFGPPQSGKSAGLAIPALLEWEGPAIASSIKTDLLAATLARRRALGRAFVFDPFDLAAGVRRHTWSPLGSAQTWDGALEVAWRLASSGEIDQRGVEGGDFWAVAAEQRLAPLLFASARSGGSMREVVSWAYGQDARGLDAALQRVARDASDDAAHGDATAAYAAVRAFETQADRTRTSIEATVQALLRAYRFARVARSADGCEITPDGLLDESATLYLVGDAKASKLLRPLFLALLSEIVDRAYAKANETGGRLERPLLVCLDEAGNVAPLPNLAEIASTAPSHNIQLLSIFHDMQQARSRYGRQAETVVNSHRARMLLPGVADLETLRYFSGLIGEEEARDLTRTSGAGGVTRSTARRRRPLLATEALRQLPDGSALLLYGRLPPARIRLRRWFEDRRLRRLANPPNHKETTPA